MVPLKVRAPEPEPYWKPRRNRRRERRLLLRALRAGLLLQGLLTLAALSALYVLRIPLGRGNGAALVASLLPAVLGPAWVAGLFIGYVAYRLRWWHLVSVGLLAAGLFFLVTALPGAWAGPALLRAWLAANLVLAPVFSGWIGRRFRERPTSARQPAPGRRA